jgi:transcription-repair coupling factor (superfamily II helicase)
LNDELLKLVSKTDAATHLKMKSGNFVVDDTIGISLLFSANFKEKPEKYLLLTSNLYVAQKVSDFIASLVGEENVFLFPVDDMLRNETLTSSKELLAQRLYVLSKALEDKPKIIVTHTSALVTPLATVNDFNSNSIVIEVGKSYKLEDLKQKLVHAGYEKVNKIDQTLQFASRGDILDIYPVTEDRPIRIEFFDDEVESIHYFDIAKQTSKEAIEIVTIEPANDILFTDLEIEEFKSKLLKEISNSENIDELKQHSLEDFERIESRIYHPQFYKYTRFAKRFTNSLVDYFKPDLVFLSNKDQIETTYEFIQKESKHYFDSLYKQGKIVKNLELYDSLENVLKYQKTILFSQIFRKNREDIEFKINPIIYSKSNVANIKIILGQYLSSSKKLVLSLSNKQQYDTVIEFLKSEKLDFEALEGLSVPKKRIGVSLYALEEGFELPDIGLTYISSKELFGFQNRSSRFLNRFKEGTILRTYEELQPGDYVVHEYYGIGRFLDIKTIEVDGIHRDFIHVQYSGTSTLYIPLNQFRLLRKYAGREGAEPKLSNLNSDDWEKTKKKIKTRINELADRLFALYSERAHGKGFAYAKDDEFQEAFENQFPYQLTEDQDAAVKAIKKDMESDDVMDRLLCGDVGFGKTEVAFRAVFKAINSGKQVAILCPTTLLARQHYELALERFRNFGVNIALISRLVPERLQKDYMKTIADGSIHLVIGTHRLLSKDFTFKDLGLLIVDEEQRFGVEQKERIKELKSNIDVLSLSATPIPRTLQLSLIGVRPVSQINTAPENRSSIQTYVAPFNEGVCRELIERELSRKGQVFYIHNVVSSINLVAKRIQKKIPSATVGVIHGKMDKDSIEDTMMRFYSGEIDVLVSTSIVENGIDVPNANLIIIEDADKFGLSQLYQIKGRVGRGNRIAYAYLFYKEQKTMNKNAQKRLKAIQDFAELGSGYKIAQRDLMIRGAGDILGPEQAGFIDSVGLELYLKLLNEVIEEKKTGKEYEPPKPVKLFTIDAYIPDAYMQKQDKVELYQEIENAKNLQELSGIKTKLRDIYGRIPHEVILLLNKRRIDILMNNEEFENVNEFSDSIEIVLSDKFSSKSGIGSALFEAIAPYLSKVSVTYIHKVLKVRLKKEDNWMKDLETIIECIVTIYRKYKARTDGKN